MFPEKVSTVTVDKIGIKVVENSKLLSGIIPLIEDMGIDCHVSSNPYLPDYVIPGYWLNDALHPQFLANGDGPHLLYATGIPKGVQGNEREKFRFPERLFISYWEDTQLGYLFQVVARDLAVKHLVNSTTN